MQEKVGCEWPNIWFSAPNDCDTKYGNSNFSTEEVNQQGLRHLCFNSIQIYVFSLIFVVVENIQPVYEQNYNLVNVVSQINGPLFVQKLHQTVYDMDEIAFLECGLTEGFRYRL